MRMESPKIAKTPAAAPTAAPLASLVTFSVTSVLASSISSRTRTCARSVTSCSAVAISFGLPEDSAAKALEDQGGHETAGECDADLPLWALLRPDRAGRRRGRQLEGGRLVASRTGRRGRRLERGRLVA